MIRAMGLGMILCLLLVCDRRAGHCRTGFRKNSGVVVDASGTPQMGATVLISSEKLLNSMALQLLTNDRGRFSTATLPAGMYSVKVTLAGFLPAVEQDIQVSDEHTTLLEIVLGSVLQFTGKIAPPAGSASGLRRLDLGAANIRCDAPRFALAGWRRSRWVRAPIPLKGRRTSQRVRALN